MKFDVFYQHIFTEERYLNWDKIARTNDQSSQGESNLRKENSSGTDYVPQMFENELALRKENPGSNDHIAAILYTTGVFADDKLKIPRYVPRLDFNNVNIVENDTDAKGKTKNSYVKNTGRLIMVIGKTAKRYNYNHIMNKVARKYIDMSIEKHPRDKLSPVGNNPTKMQHILGIGNKIYRIMFQNIYSKIFKLPLGDMSQVMGHDVNTAVSSYLDKYDYTPAAKKDAFDKINAQLKLNAKI